MACSNTNANRCYDHERERERKRDIEEDEQRDKEGEREREREREQNRKSERERERKIVCQTLHTLLNMYFDANSVRDHNHDSVHTWPYGSSGTITSSSVVTSSRSSSALLDALDSLSLAGGGPPEVTSLALTTGCAITSAPSADVAGTAPVAREVEVGASGGALGADSLLPEMRRRA